MIVFRNYFKIVRGHLKAIILYALIFILLVVFSNNSSNDGSKYIKARADIYIEDLDNSDLSRAFIDHLGRENNILDLKGKNIDDNLFYQIITVYIKIPKDFENTRQVEIKTSPLESYSIYVKDSINLFLDQIESYELSGYDTKDAIKNTEEDFNKNVKVTLENSSRSSLGQNVLNYFNFLSYAFLNQIILVVSLISLTYKEKSIANRNSVAPISKVRENLELLLGNFVFAIISWAIYIILFIVLNGSKAIDGSFKRILINSLVFVLVTVSLAVFISNVVDKGGVVTAVMNIFSLGSSFLAGVFVPQSLLSNKALTIGKLFPSFYYVANNESIFYNFDKEIYFKNILILVGFGVILAILNLVIDRIKIKKLGRY